MHCLKYSVTTDHVLGLQFVTMAGEVLSYAGFGPVAAGIGIFHTITGMDFEVTISITSCRELLPDVSFYMECLRESFAELHAAAEAKDDSCELTSLSSREPSR